MLIAVTWLELAVCKDKLFPSFFWPTFSPKDTGVNTEEDKEK